jgi:hypothetical protein
MSMRSLRAHGKVKDMLYKLTRILFCLALLALGASATLAVEDAPPAWLQQAAAASVPTYKKDVPAVVLHKEESVTVSPDGLVTTVTTYAVRILSREGRGEAVASCSYMTDAGKVRDLRAWLIRPSGQVKRYGKDEVADLALATNDVYNEVRVKAISAGDEADVGSVFGYQSISEERSVFTQFDWNFQDNLPTLVSRYMLTLPAGWRAASVTFNHAKLEPSVNASTYTWELRDLPFIVAEPESPKITNLAPRLAVSYFPAPGTPNILGKTFDNWGDVARWMSELEDPQATIDDPLASKARALTADSKTELQRIQAIGRYVQNIQYIAIQTGLGRGGGYRPHVATEVFAKSYGDCKDKANLMRAMLKAVKIDSYLVSIFSGDPTYVREEWPSPQQFNHCIIAVKVSDETQAPTVVQHPTLGRLLIFDATDENTPVGDLPDHEQGSLALVDVKEGGVLLRMPVTPPEVNQLDRRTDVQLDADGSITASVREKSLGQSAARWRRLFRGLSRPDFVKSIESWVTQGATGAKVAKVETVDGTEGQFALDVNFTVANYGQLMQSRLLVFKPTIVSRRESLFLTDASRIHPVVLKPYSYIETVRIKLPEGFEVDEMPDALKLDTAFGNYNASYEVKDGQLVFTRKLVTRASTIPAEQYASVRTFFERIRAVEQSPVVLAKK